jgi:ABC-type uncharacterized transport system substrate-binding protein
MLTEFLDLLLVAYAKDDADSGRKVALYLRKILAKGKPAEITNALALMNFMKLTTIENILKQQNDYIQVPISSEE